MTNIIKLLCKLFKFWGRKTVEMLLELAKLWLKGILWKWGLRLGLVGLLVAIAYLLF